LSPSLSASSLGWSGRLRSLARPSKLAALGIVFAARVIGCASGCGHRTILIPSDDALLRVGKGGARMRVWLHLEGKWVDSGSELDIPEGWYLLPPRFVEEE